MTTQELTSTNNALSVSAAATDQYTLPQILGIWVIVTLPMILLAWVAPPIVIPYIPLHPGVTYWLLLIVGMMLAMGIFLDAARWARRIRFGQRSKLGMARQV